MKTQIANRSCDPVLFAAPQAKASKSGHVNGSGPFFPRLSSEPAAAGPISASTTARRYHSNLPASLADWLVCKEALDICRKDGNGQDHGGDAWVSTAKPVTHVKILPVAVARS
jgi:hypothetical protein